MSQTQIVAALDLNSRCGEVYQLLSRRVNVDPTLHELMRSLEHFGTEGMRMGAIMTSVSHGFKVVLPDGAHLVFEANAAPTHALGEPAPMAKFAMIDSPVKAAVNHWARTVWSEVGRQHCRSYVRDDGVEIWTAGAGVFKYRLTYTPAEGTQRVH